MPNSTVPSTRSQAVRFPYRQVFGDPDEVEVAQVFKPTVAYEVKVAEFTAVEVVDPVVFDPPDLGGGPGEPS